MIENKLLLRTINGEKVDRPPIWLMRQAGRILPEYREVRASVENFVALVRNPELAAEVTEGCNVLYWMIMGDKVMKQVKSE